MSDSSFQTYFTKESLVFFFYSNLQTTPKWKKVKDLLAQIPELYRKLSEIAYLDNGNFQEIVYLLKFKDEFDPYQKVKDETGKEIFLLERLCGAYIEEKKKNLNLPSGNNDKERKEFKCYFAKSKYTNIKTDENKLTVENGNFKEIVEIKSDEVSEFVYEDD